MLAPTFVETPMTERIVPELRRKGMSFASVESVAGVVGRLVCERGRGRGVNGELRFPFSPWVLSAVSLRLYWSVCPLGLYCGGLREHEEGSFFQRGYRMIC